jgi:signal peptidase II
VLVIALDQWTKWWVLHHVSPGPHHLLGPLGMDVGRNTGVAFSLISGHSALAFVLAAALTVVVAACVARVLAVLPAIVFGLLLGGAIGNLADRIFRHASGGVVDFLTLPHWATFNVADSAITVGIAGLIVLLVLRRPLFIKGGRS